MELHLTLWLLVSFISGAGFENELNQNPEKFYKMIDDDYPLGRMGKPEEVA